MSDIKNKRDVQEGKQSESPSPLEEKPELENQNSQGEIPFKVSEQEEIEYIQTEMEEKEESCAGETAARETESGMEKLIEQLKSEIKQKEEEISRLKETLEELRDKFLRAVAEAENVRKRTEREKEEFYQYALADLLRDLLPVVDNFERALKSAGDEANGKTFREGVELIYRMMLNLLKKYGVRPIEIQDRKFDPNLHQALASEESTEVTEPEIKEELQKGYLIHNRLLRPSMVKVLIPKKN
ncbi:MAG: nucleotide exchange factor GrpE [Candidatus Saccharicenans sp.]|nr:nucleotide exchange factor GrpE [Candidatus Saccharicenans sp.]